MFGVPSAAIILLGKTGFYLARKQKWLPKTVYHRLSLDSLKAGDFDGAAKYNALALQKDPNYEKAQVVHDLLRMNRDAHIEDIRASAEQHMLEISRLRLEKRAKLERLKILQYQKTLLKLRALIFLLLLLFTVGFVWVVDIQFQFDDYLWFLPAFISLLLFLYLGQRAVKSAREIILNGEQFTQEIRSYLRDLDINTAQHRQSLKELGEEMVKMRTKILQ